MIITVTMISINLLPAQPAAANLRKKSRPFTFNSAAMECQLYFTALISRLDNAVPGFMTSPSGSPRLITYLPAAKESPPGCEKRADERDVEEEVGIWYSGMLAA